MDLLYGVHIGEALTLWKSMWKKMSWNIFPWHLSIIKPNLGIPAARAKKIYKKSVLFCCCFFSLACTVDVSVCLYASGLSLCSKISTMKGLLASILLCPPSARLMAEWELMVKEESAYDWKTLEEYLCCFRKIQILITFDNSFITLKEYNDFNIVQRQ